MLCMYYSVCVLVSSYPLAWSAAWRQAMSHLPLHHKCQITNRTQVRDQNTGLTIRTGLDPALQTTHCLWDPQEVRASPWACSFLLPWRPAARKRRKGKRMNEKLEREGEGEKESKGEEGKKRGESRNNQCRKKQGSQLILGNFQWKNRPKWFVDT